jgi:ubiquinone/menaquinone biosynthesis C-methylase UbiE
VHAALNQLEPHVQFTSPLTARVYSDRAVDDTWAAWATQTLAPQGKDVVDIGCGGGIYSRAFESVGARSVVGVDQSGQYIDEAASQALPMGRSRFQVGTASSTQLPDESADIVFERALIHHLSQPAMRANAIESRRLLRPGGLLVVQDRTIEDVQSTSPRNWIRSALFEVRPDLIEFERSRRPAREEYAALLSDAGFAKVRELAYDEVRKAYSSFDELRAEILSRKGKSILFELSDAELHTYCDRLRELSRTHELIERDAWTVWLAAK